LYKLIDTCDATPLRPLLEHFVAQEGVHGRQLLANAINLQQHGRGLHPLRYILAKCEGYGSTVPYKYVQMIRILLEFGANDDTSKKSSDSPLAVCARRGQLELARALVRPASAGGQWIAVGEAAWRAALLAACQSADRAMVQLLLASGQDHYASRLDALGVALHTVVEYACRRSSSTDVVDVNAETIAGWLVARGADPLIGLNVWVRKIGGGGNNISPATTPKARGSWNYGNNNNVIRNLGSGNILTTTTTSMPVAPSPVSSSSRPLSHSASPSSRSLTQTPSIVIPKPAPPPRSASSPFTLYASPPPPAAAGPWSSTLAPIPDDDGLPPPPAAAVASSIPTVTSGLLAEPDQMDILAAMSGCSAGLLPEPIFEKSVTATEMASKAAAERITTEAATVAATVAAAAVVAAEAEAAATALIAQRFRDRILRLPASIINQRLRMRPKSDHGSTVLQGDRIVAWPTSELNHLALRLTERMDRVPKNLLHYTISLATPLSRMTDLILDYISNHLGEEEDRVWTAVEQARWSSILQACQCQQCTMAIVEQPTPVVIHIGSAWISAGWVGDAMPTIHEPIANFLPSSLKPPPSDWPRDPSPPYEPTDSFSDDVFSEDGAGGDSTNRWTRHAWANVLQRLKVDVRVHGLRSLGVPLRTRYGRSLDGSTFVQWIAGGAITHFISGHNQMVKLLASKCTDPRPPQPGERRPSDPELIAQLANARAESMCHLVMVVRPGPSGIGELVQVRAPTATTTMIGARGGLTRSNSNVGPTFNINGTTNMSSFNVNFHSRSSSVAVSSSSSVGRDINRPSDALIELWAQKGDKTILSQSTATETVYYSPPSHFGRPVSGTPEAALWSRTPDPCQGAGGPFSWLSGRQCAYSMLWFAYCLSERRPQLPRVTECWLVVDSGVASTETLTRGEERTLLEAVTMRVQSAVNEAAHYAGVNRIQVRSAGPAVFWQAIAADTTRR
jgi:hypothetical protein